MYRRERVFTDNFKNKLTTFTTMCNVECKVPEAYVHTFASMLHQEIDEYLEQVSNGLYHASVLPQPKPHPKAPELENENEVEIESTTERPQDRTKPHCDNTSAFPKDEPKVCEAPEQRNKKRRKRPVRSRSAKTKPPEGIETAPPEPLDCSHTGDAHETDTESNTDSMKTDTESNTDSMDTEESLCGCRVEITPPEPKNNSPKLSKSPRPSTNSESEYCDRHGTLYCTICEIPRPFSDSDFCGRHRILHCPVCETPRPPKPKVKKKKTKRKN